MKMHEPFITSCFFFHPYPVSLQIIDRYGSSYFLFLPAYVPFYLRSDDFSLIALVTHRAITNSFYISISTKSLSIYIHPHINSFLFKICDAPLIFIPYHFYHGMGRKSTYFTKFLQDEMWLRVNGHQMHSVVVVSSINNQSQWVGVTSDEHATHVTVQITETAGNCTRELHRAY